MYSKKQVAECLRAQRAKHRLSRQELSNLADIATDTIGNAELEKSNITLENAWKLADVYNMGMDELFEREVPHG